MKRWVVVAAALFGLAAACSSPVDLPVAQPAPAEPTEAPRPSPTRDSQPPTPTQEPAPLEPTAESTATPQPPATAVSLPRPRFEPASGPVALLADTVFDEGSLPPELQPDPIGGGAIINSQADPSDAETVAMFWAVRRDHANFVVARLEARDASGSPTWRAVDTWVLLFEPGSLVTIGTHVCIPPNNSFDQRNGEFIAVTNQTWDVALGAWTMTLAGPTAYSDVAQLDCEEFFP